MGMALIVIGAMLFLFSYLLQNSNWLLLGGLVLVILGVAAHIKGIKRQGKY